MNQNKLLSRIALLISVLCWSTNSWALSSDKEQAMHIQADRASLDNQQGVTVYIGQVDIKQGSLELKADKVTLNYDQNNNVQRIVAEMQGDNNTQRVYFRQLLDTQEELKAHALRMEYDAEKDVLHLKKKAQVEKNKDTFSGEYIIYDAKRGKITAESQQQERISVVIQPRKQAKSE